MEETLHLYQIGGEVLPKLEETLHLYQIGGEVSPKLAVIALNRRFHDCKGVQKFGGVFGGHNIIFMNTPS
jgi:hypothetical protein